MTEHQAAARTNFFACNDIPALIAALSALKMTTAICVEHRGPAGTVRLHANTEFGNWPTTTAPTPWEDRHDDESDEVHEETRMFRPL